MQKNEVSSKSYTDTFFEMMLEKQQANFNRPVH